MAANYEPGTSRYEQILAKQRNDWPKDLAGSKQGNPFATLCSHCYGRHIPPRDEICPHDPPG
jgi:hypothetical protein